MTDLDTRLIPRVLELITKYGKDVTFKTFPSATYTPTTGKTTPGAETDYSEKVTPPEPYEDKFIDGEIVQIGDCRVYLAASGLAFTPEKGMEVEFDAEGITWRIVRIMPVYTGESIAMYGLQLRR